MGVEIKKINKIELKQADSDASQKKARVNIEGKSLENVKDPFMRQKLKGIALSAPTPVDMQDIVAEEDESLSKRLENVAKTAQSLEAIREDIAVDAKFQDLKYVKMLDNFIYAITDALTQSVKDPRALQTAVKKIVSGGDFKKLKDLLIALNIAVGDRNDLLGFDETRQAKGKKKLKLQVLWKGNTGEQAAIQAETSES